MRRHGRPTTGSTHGWERRLARSRAGARASCSGGRPTRCSSPPGRRGRSRRTPDAPFFNDTTKYVVSGTLTEATLRNSEMIGRYDPDAIRRLKAHVGGDIYVGGSITLVHAMLDDRLIDGLHLFVYPLTRGSGPRLFPDGALPKSFSLEACESYENGVVYLTTGRAGSASAGGDSRAVSSI